jgi:hypothetical protein
VRPDRKAALKEVISVLNTLRRTADAAGLRVVGSLLDIACYEARDELTEDLVEPDIAGDRRPRLGKMIRRWLGTRTPLAWYRRPRRV